MSLPPASDPRWIGPSSGGHAVAFEERVAWRGKALSEGAYS